MARTRGAGDKSDLSSSDREHLRNLVADWTLLSDLAFADLVLWVPTWNETGFVAMAQLRPTTAPTSQPEDLVSRFVPRGRRPILDRAFATGRIVAERANPAIPAAEEAVPVLHGDRVVAVIGRYTTPRAEVGGALEAAYLSTADDLAQMVAGGEFPMPEGTAETDAPPRAGDGLIRLGTDGRVRFASPNALSAFHRLGLATDLADTDLGDTAARLLHRPGPVDEAVVLVASGRVAGTAEVDNDEAAVTLRSLPLRRHGRSVGALVLVRDVTDLRRRERALLTKDAMIREIHHRVKNNLQTVAALLRLQARRIDIPAGRAALEEAVRRVGAIAVVHDTLARAEGGAADFDELADRVMALMSDLSGGGSGSTRFVRDGTFGPLPTEVTSPLAMALAELLQNAVQHGLDGADGQVTLVARRRGRHLTVEVADNGRGLPEGFAPAASGGLGLEIVRTLVTGELGGALSWEPNPGGGTRVIIDLLVPNSG